MTKRQFCFLLGLVGQARCVVYEDALRRDASDAATDAPRDGALGARDARLETAHPDAALPDVEASRDAGTDADRAEDVTTIEDVRDPNDARDPGDAVAEREATVGPLPDASTPDVAGDGRVDTADAVDESDTSGGDDREASVDALGDPPIVGCTVDFTVSGVTWDVTGPPDAADSGLRVVRLVGSANALGAWDPGSAPPMTEKAPGAWSTSVALADDVALEFKFVKVDAGRAPEWEQWPPFDSNRSLLVECSADGGTVWVDAATEVGPANRAVGRSYGGAFGVRPLDATK
jgi:Starch binding domain